METGQSLDRYIVPPKIKINEKIITAHVSHSIKRILTLPKFRYLETLLTTISLFLIP